MSTNKFLWGWSAVGAKADILSIICESIV
jgi:hypothetical protein